MFPFIYLGYNYIMIAPGCILIGWCGTTNQSIGSINQLKDVISGNFQSNQIRLFPGKEKNFSEKFKGRLLKRVRQRKNSRLDTTDYSKNLASDFHTAFFSRSRGTTPIFREKVRRFWKKSSVKSMPHVSTSLTINDTLVREQEAQVVDGKLAGRPGISSHGTVEHQLLLLLRRKKQIIITIRVQWIKNECKLK